MRSEGTDIYMTAGEYGVPLTLRLMARNEAAVADLLRSDVLRFAVSRRGEDLLERTMTLGEMEAMGGTMEIIWSQEESSKFPPGRYAWRVEMLRDDVLRETLADGPFTVMSSVPAQGPCGPCTMPFPPRGRDILTPRGEYDPTVVYRRLDMVRYQGALYVARRGGVQGEPPTDGEDWMLLVRDGTPGLQGEPGKDGAPGKKGATGEKGDPGPAATINGQSALTLAGGTGIKVTQDGDTVTVALDVPDGNEVGY